VAAKGCDEQGVVHQCDWDGRSVRRHLQLTRVEEKRYEGLPAMAGKGPSWTVAGTGTSNPEEDPVAA
jgi:hypothetical protein